MRPALSVFLVLVSLTVSSTFAGNAAKEEAFTFENDVIGATPAGFEFARTGRGAEGKWTVELERDVTLTVRARPLRGEVDQGFGLVWRYRDVNNYYVTRCNADEDNCTIYHVVNGSRRPFQS